MKLKQAILTIVDRGARKAGVDELEIERAYWCNVEELRTNAEL